MIETILLLIFVYFALELAYSAGHLACALQVLDASERPETVDFDGDSW